MADEEFTYGTKSQQEQVQSPLTPEEQARIQRIQQAKALLGALSSQTIKPQEGQMVSGWYVKPNLLSNIAKTAIGAYGLGKSMDNTEETAIRTGAAQRYSTEGAAEVAHLKALAATDKAAAVQQAGLSQRPEVQRWGKALATSLAQERADRPTQQLQEGAVTETAPGRPLRVVTPVTQATVPNPVEGGPPITVNRNAVGGFSSAGTGNINSMSVDMGKGINNLSEQEGKDLLKRSQDLRTQAVSTIPTFQRLQQNIEKGQVQGTQQGLQQTFLNAASSLGFTGKDAQDVLTRSQSSTQAFAELARTKLKSYGSGTGISNLDLMSAKVTNGGLDNTPQGLFLINQAAQADMYNAIMLHNREVQMWQHSNPEYSGRTSHYTVPTPSLPQLKVDANLFKLNPESGYFEPTGEVNPSFKLPKPALLGTQIEPPANATGGQDIDALIRKYTQPGQ